MKKHIFLLFFLLYAMRLSAGERLPAGEGQVIKTFQEEWLKIDENNRYVPFIGNEKMDTPAIGIVLDLPRYVGNSLRCCVPKQSAILIEQQIVGHYDKAHCVVFDIDSLHRLYGQEQILISVYQPKSLFENLDFSIVTKNKGQSIAVDDRSLKRENSSLENFFIVGLLVLLGSYAFQINQFPKTFKNLYDFGKIFSFKTREENGRVRLFHELHLVFLLHHALLVAYLLILLTSAHGLVDLSMVIGQPDTFWAFVVTWLKLSIAVFFVMWLKYMVVMILGSLFGLKALKYMHVLDFMRMSLIFWSFVFVSMALIYASALMANSFYVNTLVYVFIAFAIVRIIILYYRLFTSRSFRNVYLFSYICASEIIPLFVGLELFID